MFIVESIITFLFGLVPVMLLNFRKYALKADLKILKKDRTLIHENQSGGFFNETNNSLLKI